MVSVLASVAELDFSRYLRAGDAILWAQACAEPRTLVEHLLAQLADGRAAAGLRAFIGVPVAGTISPRRRRRQRRPVRGGRPRHPARALLVVSRAHPARRHRR